MNVEWALEKLEAYYKLCDQYDLTYEQSGYNYTDRCRRLHEQGLIAEPTVVKVLESVDPALAEEFLGPGYDSSNAKTKVLKGIGVLRHREEWERNLAPTAPLLIADSMHPIVWTAAATVWETGEFKIAAQQAAVSLSAHIKSKAESHLNERDLVAQVFKTDPPTPDICRLHFPGNTADRNWQSRQQGLHLIAQGAFAGIRNIAVHDESSWPEPEALEHLAVLSVVARWSDQTEIKRASE